jgi:methylisocitrate lyase
MDPLTGLLAEKMGFEAGYLGGGALGYVKTGLEANLSLTQLAQTGAEIAAATQLPLILDANCGWGNAMNMHHTRAVSEAAGFAAIELEDQILPRRAHHHIGIEHMIPAESMVDNIREAVAARCDADFVIIARTNACRSEGIDEAIRRAKMYREAGADMLFVLQKDSADLCPIGEAVGDVPLLCAVTSGLEALNMSLNELSELGYRLVMDGASSMLAAHKAVRESFAAFQAWERDPSVGDDYAGETDRVHQLLNLKRLLDIEHRTVEKDCARDHLLG